MKTLKSEPAAKPKPEDKPNVDAAIAGLDAKVGRGVPLPKLTPFSFGRALLAMRDEYHPGRRVTRIGWNEPKKFLTFANGVIYCTRDGHQFVWSPNQADIVALDWELA